MERAIPLDERLRHGGQQRLAVGLGHLLLQDEAVVDRLRLLGDDLVLAAHQRVEDLLAGPEHGVHLANQQSADPVGQLRADGLHRWLGDGAVRCAQSEHHHREAGFDSSHGSSCG